MSNTFTKELHALSQNALDTNKFALDSGYSSKKEVLCRAFINRPDVVIDELINLYRDAKLFFGASALEQRMAISMLDAVISHHSFRFARCEVCSLIDALIDNDVSVEAIRTRMSHSTDTTAKAVIKAAEQWGFIKYDHGKYSPTNSIYAESVINAYTESKQSAYRREAA